MSMRILPRVLWALAICNVALSIGQASPVPGPEDVRVGVIVAAPPNDTPVANSHGTGPLRPAEVIQAVRVAFVPYGIEVVPQDAREDPSTLLAENSDLAFVVEFLGSSDHPQALIYAVGMDRVVRMDAEGERALDSLVTRVLEHISTPELTKSAVQRQAHGANSEHSEARTSELLALGLAARAEGNREAAIRLLQDAVEKEPASARAHYALAICFDEMGKATESVRHVRLALAADPFHEDASIALANHFLDEREYGKAIALYRKWLDSPKNSNLVRWNLAIAFTRLGQPREAVSYLEQIDRQSSFYVRAQERLLTLSEQAGAGRGWKLGSGAIAVLAIGAWWVVRRQRQRKPCSSAPITTATMCMEETQPIASPPSRIGDYDILERIGKGGMGEVFLGRHRHLDRLFAIKLLPSGGVVDPMAVERFQREMRAAGKLDHPNVLRATDAGYSAGNYYLVTDYLKGIDLGEHVKRNGPLSIDEACFTIYQVAQALQHVHDAGLVHRDVKPSNIMKCEHRRIVLIDFGLARLLDLARPDAGATQSGQFIGTPDFVAPEVVSGTEIDARADIYSLGCSLYVLLTGRPPFGTRHLTLAAKAQAHIAEEPVPVEQLREGLPPVLAELVRRMMAKDPTQRVPTARQVAEALQAILEEMDQSTIENLLVTHTHAVAGDVKYD
jgi:tetratricopeptide (TPR) repeat protein